MFHLDRPMYLLGYLASQSKVYLIDKVSTPGPHIKVCSAWSLVQVVDTYKSSFILQAHVC